MKHLIALVALLLSCASPVLEAPVLGTAEVTEMPLAPYPLDAFEDPSGRLWFGSVGSGVFCWTQDGIREYHAADGLVGDRNMGFACGPDGTIWFTSAEPHFGGRSALMAWTQQQGFRQFAFPDTLSGAIEGVHFDDSGQMWLDGTAGIFQFDGERFTPFEIPGERKPMDYSPHRWFQSRDGRIWFGTPDRGLWVWDGETYLHFDSQSGLLTDNAAVLCEDHLGQIYISCFGWHLPDSIPQGGVLRWNGFRMDSFPTVEGLLGNDVYSGICDQQGAVWLGATGKGVYRITGSEQSLYRTFAHGSPDQPVFGMNGISEDASGRLHFCFAGGLYHLVNEQFVHCPRTHMPRP